MQLLKFIIGPRSKIILSISIVMIQKLYQEKKYMTTQEPASPTNMVSQDFISTGFRQVDSQSNPTYYVQFLDYASADDVLALAKRRTFELLDVRPGGQYLDIGCGIGDDVRALAQAVGPTGSVVGVDGSAAMIAESWKRTEGLNLPVKYIQGDAIRLDFADASFDGCMAQQVLLYLTTPRQALAEMVRVARSGARITVFDWDAESITTNIFPNRSDRALRRKFLDFVADSFPSGTIGRQLPGLFRELGLIDIAIEPTVLMQTGLQLGPDGRPIARGLLDGAYAASVLSAEEFTRARAEVEDAINSGLYFDASIWFHVSGRKP
jgi:ubiquinone/menaquinone biosynthesis C-methylase UbiE